MLLSGCSVIETITGVPLHQDETTTEIVIVTDSDPESEWQETQSKMRAVLQAASLACAGLDTQIENHHA